EALLGGSRVRFVGTATIGTDHLDLSWLAQHAIEVAAAPGSNASSVVDYVLAALSRLDGMLERLLAGATVGVIGAGNVGSRLIQRLRGLGIATIACDPLLHSTAKLPLHPLQAALAADVVCLHTPLTRTGSNPTWHLLGEHELEQLRPDAV